MRAYLLKYEDKVIERPQDLWMRVALTISGDEFDYENTRYTYTALSKGYYSHATPTLFNSGLKMQQLSSCFLIAMENDSIEGIFNTVKDCALISKTAGGIGLHAHNIRASGSRIKSTNGKSNGLIPFLKIFNETARSVDQGGGKRKGSFAVYLEPWHADIEHFLELRKNTGAEEFRARDLFYALWIPDLFMKRVENDEIWTLMSEHECPGLSDNYGEEFEKLYTKYEKLFPQILDANVDQFVLEFANRQMSEIDIWKRKNIGKMKLIAKHIKPFQIPFSLALAMFVSLLELIFSFIISLNKKK